jgi:hypothetical protein
MSATFSECPRLSRQTENLQENERGTTTLFISSSKLLRFLDGEAEPRTGTILETE